MTSPSFGLLAILILSVSSAMAAPQVLQTSKIASGDTFIANGEQVKLRGIIAPPEDHAHFLASKLFLETVLLNKQITCRYHETDFYLRKVMSCSIEGDDIAAMAVQMGTVRAEPGYYTAEEEHAKAHHYGIWADVSNE